MANPTLQSQLIDKAHEIQENIAALTEQRAANRRSLRDLATQGMLSEDEYAAVEEVYPVREAKSDEERLAEAEEKAAQLRERLAAEQSE
jgi:hypothetical protein